MLVTMLLALRPSFFEVHTQAKWIMQYAWPSGITVALATYWVGLAKDVRRRLGYELYNVIKRDVEKYVRNEGRRTRFLGYLVDVHDVLLSGDKSARTYAIGRLIVKFKTDGWPECEGK